MSDFAFIPGVTRSEGVGFAVPQAATLGYDGAIARKEDQLHRIAYWEGPAQRTMTPVRTLNVVIDGRGTELVVGIAGDATMDFHCRIVYWKLVSDQVGSVQIDIWREPYSDYPPTDADTITGGNEPFLTTADKNEDDLLTDWTTELQAGDILRFNVDSVTDITRVLLALKLETR